MSENVMTDNVTNIKKSAERDVLGKFVQDSEEDFRAIELLARAIEELTEKEESAHIWILAREIGEHLESIKACFDDEAPDDAA